MNIYIILFLIVLFPNRAFSQIMDSKEQREVYNTIVLIGKSWAENNLDTLEKYIDKDYLHTDVKGQALDRAAWLNYIKERKEKGISNPIMEFEDIDIAIYNDFAFVTGANIFLGPAYTETDTKDKHKLRFTQVLRKEGGIWKRLLFQATYMVD